MATASNESTVSPPSEYCSTCDTNKTEKYCNDCQMSFCGTCTKIHQKMKGSGDHIVKDISPSENTLGSEGSQIVTGDVRLNCSKHTNEEVRQFCESCVELLCSKCSNDHTNHKIDSISKDDFLKLNRKVSAKKKQVLMSAIQNLEEYNTIVDTCTSRLKEAIKRLEDEQENVKLLIDDMDTQVGKLHATRNSIDYSSLWNEAGSSNIVIEKFEQFKSTLSKNGKPVQVDTILEKVCVAESVDDEQSCLPADDTSKMYRPLNDFEIQSSVAPVGYILCKYCPDDIITMHTFGKSYIQYLNVFDCSFVEAKSERSIWEMIMLEINGFLIVHGSQRQFCLLDGNLCCKDTLLAKQGFSAMAMCKISSDRYLLYELSDNFPSRGSWTEVFVHQNEIRVHKKLSNVKFYNDKPYFMSFLKKTNQLLLCSDKNMYTFEYPRQKYVKHDIRSFISGEVMCMNTDADDNVLVGDREGKIHLFDNNFQHEQILVLVNHEPRDVAVKGERLIITTTSNRVIIFAKPQ